MAAPSGQPRTAVLQGARRALVPALVLSVVIAAVFGAVASYCVAVYACSRDKSPIKHITDSQWGTPAGHRWSTTFMTFTLRQRAQIGVAMAPLSGPFDATEAATLVRPDLFGSNDWPGLLLADAPKCNRRLDRPGGGRWDIQAGGWPRPCFASIEFDIVGESAGPAPPKLTRLTVGQTAILPTRPMWRGLVLDTLVLGQPALVACLAIFAAVPLRRLWRIQRGLCPKCAYDLKGSFEAGCPECGWNRGGADMNVAM